jgi:hypothetical protein
MKKLNIISLLVVALTFFVGCTQTEFNAIPAEKLMGDSLVANYTISQLIDSFMTDSDKYTDLTRSGINSGLFTSNLMSASGDIVIKGIVTSTDVEGNIYKYITIQEPNGMAMKISVDAAGLSAVYPLGQRVWVRCNGLYMGKYAQSPQIGTLYFNPEKSTIQRVIKSDSVVVNGTKVLKLDTSYVTVYRREPGRIPLPIAMKAIHRYGMPDPNLIKADTLTIAQIRAGGKAIINKLVCIKNAYFTGRGADYNLPVNINAADLIFAPSTNGIGYPQSREIQDGTGSIFISTSEYSKFATKKLPDSGNRGNITAIVGWYNDKYPGVNPTQSTTEIYHQLTIRSLDDLGKGFEQFHATVK